MSQADPSLPVRPKRRWFQYNLRSLLILTTVAAALFGVHARWSYKARQQQKALSALTPAGISVFYDFQIERIDIQSSFPIRRASVRPPLWPRWLVNVMGVDYFGTVFEVDLYGMSVTDESLQPLEQLPALKYVFIDHSQVTDAGVARLQKALPNCKIIVNSGRSMFD